MEVLEEVVLPSREKVEACCMAFTQLPRYNQFYSYPTQVISRSEPNHTLIALNQYPSSALLRGRVRMVGEKIS